MIEALHKDTTTTDAFNTMKDRKINLVARFAAIYNTLM